MIFTATVRIETDTLEHAQQVLNERTGYDEWLGFDYWISADLIVPEPVCHLPRWVNDEGVCEHPDHDGPT